MENNGRKGKKYERHRGYNKKVKYKQNWSPIDGKGENEAKEILDEIIF